MRTAILLISMLLLQVVFSTIDLSVTDDSQLGDLLEHNWYGLLPTQIKGER